MDTLSQIFDDIHLNHSHYLYLKASNSWEVTCEASAAMLAYVVLKGDITLALNQHQLELCSGDLVLLPAAQAHKIFQNNKNVMTTKLQVNDYSHFNSREVLTLVNNDQDISHSIILIIQTKMDVQMAKPLLKALPDFIHIPHITSNTAPEWLQIGLQFLTQETHSLRPGRDKILDHLVSILFIECVRDYILNLKDQSNWLNALTHTELSNALSAIHVSPEQAWTVESLAERCCMSRSKFAQLFTQMLGEPPLAYLQQHRLRLAAQYLRAGQYSIQSIASLVGYRSETAFSQAFKRQFSMSPSQYRHQQMILESTLVK